MSRTEPLRRLGLRVGLVGLIAISLMALATWLFEPLSQSNVSAAVAWNRQVAELGIRPVYPPTEDFHVGDIFAVLVTEGGTGSEALTPLPARAVRIGNVPLRKEIATAMGRRPWFEPSQATSDAARLDQPVEQGEWPAGDNIRPSLVGFPSLTRRLGIDAAGTISALLGRAEAEASAQDIEEISLPEAYTFGVDAAVGAIELNNWCRTDRYRCDSAFVRRLLAFSLGARAVPDNQAVDVILVTQVYLTRRIQLRRGREEQRSAQGSVVQSASEGAAAPSGTARAKNTSAETWSANTDFARPVVIGFRSVGFAR